MKIAEDSAPILSALDRPNSYIGRSVPRPNLGRLTQGRAQYVSDLSLPRMAHVAFVRSPQDRKSTRLNSSHTVISYAVFCLKKKKQKKKKYETKTTQANQ